MLAGEVGRHFIVQRRDVASGSPWAVKCSLSALAHSSTAARSRTRASADGMRAHTPACVHARVRVS